MSVPIGQQPIDPGAPLSEQSSVQASTAPKSSVVGGHSYKKYTGFTGKILSLFGKAVKIEGDKGGSFYVRKSDIARTITKLAESQQKEFPELKRTNKVLMQTLFKKTKITEKDLREGLVGAATDVWKKDAVTRMSQQFLSLDLKKWEALISKTPPLSGKELSEAPFKEFIDHVRTVLKSLVSYPEILASLDIATVENRLNSIALNANPLIPGLDEDIAEVFASPGVIQLMSKESEKNAATSRSGKERVEQQIFPQLQKEHFIMRMARLSISQCQNLPNTESQQEEIMKIATASQERIKKLCGDIKDADLIKELITPRQIIINPKNPGVGIQQPMTAKQKEFGDFAPNEGKFATIEPFLKARLKELQGK